MERSPGPWDITNSPGVIPHFRAAPDVRFPPMERTIRFTVSLPDRLMRTLDRVRAGRRYANRSEFIRDRLRAELVKEERAGRRGETRGGLTLGYDHATRERAANLHDDRHTGYNPNTDSPHIHLDQPPCLDVMALRGPVRTVRALANELLATKGVRYGQLVPASRGKLWS